jgi:peptidoglycan biosynthesis protein MviN/MurJ (putative lipid II flippase)
MIDQDRSLDCRLTTVQGNERICRCVSLLVDVGTMIGAIATLLALLIVIWAAGREVRVAWGWA